MLQSLINNLHLEKELKILNDIDFLEDTLFQEIKNLSLNYYISMERTQIYKSIVFQMSGN